MTDLKLSGKAKRMEDDEVDGCVSALWHLARRATPTNFFGIDAYELIDHVHRFRRDPLIWGELLIEQTVHFLLGVGSADVSQRRDSVIAWKRGRW